MSSSDEEAQIKQKSKKGGDKKKEYSIKPAKGGPSLDTSEWPLLLKVIIFFNYKVRTLIH